MTVATQAEVREFVDSFANFMQALDEILYIQLYALSEQIEAALDSRRVHLRDSEGRLITHFDEWLLAAEAGRWPVEVHGGK